ncbi:MAG TPA: hypothetical protein VFP85_14450 [Vicinamibacterales bacterium]|nr:hypothetical protein [Vicinamibacterales bacterium]
MTAGLKALAAAGLLCASMWTVYTQYVVLPMTDHVTSRTFRDQSIEQYEQILNGTRPFPYQWRVAGPHLVKWLSTASGRDPHVVDVVLKVTALTVSAFFLLQIAARWLSPIAVIATAALYFLMTAAGYSSEGYSIYYTNDFLMVAGWNAALALMVAGQWAAAAAVIFLTAWAKETVFLLALLALVAWWRGRATPIQAVLCVLAFAIPTVILRTIYPAPFGEWAWWHNLGLNLSSPDVLKLALFFNVWGVLAFLAWRRTSDRFLRDLGLLAMLYVAIMFVVIDLRELRHFMPLLIIVLPAAIAELERRLAARPR